MYDTFSFELKSDFRKTIEHNSLSCGRVTGISAVAMRTAPSLQLLFVPAVALALPSLNLLRLKIAAQGISLYLNSSVHL